MKTTPKPKKAKYRFEIYSTRGDFHGSPLDTWYWRCRHRNGNIVDDGAEGYSSKTKLKRSLLNKIAAIKAGDYEIKEI